MTLLTNRSAKAEQFDPDSLYLFRCVFRGELKGVVELGKVGEFSQAEQHMLINSAEPIAIAINSLESRGNPSSAMQ